MRASLLLGFLLTSWTRTNTSCRKRTTFYSNREFCYPVPQLVRPGGEGVLIPRSVGVTTPPPATIPKTWREISLPPFLFGHMSPLCLRFHCPQPVGRPRRPEVWEKAQSLNLSFLLCMCRNRKTCIRSKEVLLLCRVWGRKNWIRLERA